MEWTTLNTHEGKGKELYDYLCRTLEIPKHPVSLDIHMVVGQAITFDVKYYPEVLPDGRKIIDVTTLNSTSTVKDIIG